MGAFWNEFLPLSKSGSEDPTPCARVRPSTLSFGLFLEVPDGRSYFDAKVRW